MTDPDQTTLGDLLERGRRGWPAAYPIAQLPNPPLIVAGAGLAVAAIADGGVGDVAQATGYAGLAAWSWLEVTDGANAARRALGAAGLVFVIARMADALGG